MVTEGLHELVQRLIPSRRERGALLNLGCENWWPARGQEGCDDWDPAEKNYEVHNCDLNPGRPVPNLKVCDLNERWPYPDNFADVVLSVEVIEHCLCPEVPVITAEGAKPVSKCKAGDMVLTHRGRFRRVTKVMCHEYSGPVMRYGDARVTPSHRVCVAENPLYVKGRERKEPKFDTFWVEIGKITNENRICYPIITETVDVPQINVVDVIADKEKRRVYEQTMHLVKSLKESGLSLREAFVKAHLSTGVPPSTVSKWWRGQHPYHIWFEIDGKCTSRTLKYRKAFRQG